MLIKSVKVRNKTYPGHFVWFIYIKIEAKQWIKQWITSIDPLSVRITNKGGKVLFNIKAIHVFKDKFTCHYLINYTNGESRHYEPNQLKFEFSCLSDKKSRNCFEYFKRIAENTKLYYDKKDKDNKEGISDFIIDNYIYFIIGTIVLSGTVVGYIIVRKRSALWNN